MHQAHAFYNYDSLRSAIRRIDPDVIAVEIRSEDVDADTAYLKQNYPLEMWMMRYWFPKQSIAGIDWLGADISGKPIPANYWKEVSRIKQLERQLQADSAFRKNLAPCDTSRSLRLRNLNSSSLPELIKGPYHALTDAFYTCHTGRLKGTPYQYIAEFYAQRNKELAARTLAIIRRNPGKRIVVLTGADHYYPIRQYLLQEGVVTGNLN
jgi:hypothetical protein